MKLFRAGLLENNFPRTVRNRDAAICTIGRHMPARCCSNTAIRRSNNAVLLRRIHSWRGGAWRLWVFANTTVSIFHSVEWLIHFIHCVLGVFRAGTRSEPV